VGLERLVVDHPHGREGDAALGADPDRIARQPVLLDHGAAAFQQPLVQMVQVLVGLWSEHVVQARPRRRHRQRVAVEGADLEDTAVLDAGHHLVRPADRARRQPGAERLCEGDQIGDDAEVLDCPAGGDGQAGLDLVEDQDDAVLRGQLAHGLEVARLGEHHPEVHHRRLHDHAGRAGRPSARAALDPAAPSRRRR
jgi:hypothetical protein